MAKKRQITDPDELWVVLDEACHEKLAYAARHGRRRECKTLKQCQREMITKAGYGLPPILMAILHRVLWEVIQFFAAELFRKLNQQRIESGG